MKQKILIVTRDLIGPVRNGGIGTACTSLAEHFVREGKEVHILWTPGAWVEDKGDNIAKHIADYGKKGISLIPLPNPAPGKYEQENYYYALCHRVYEWCADKDYQAIIVHEWGAHGGFLSAGRRQGKVKSPVIAWVHSPTTWHVMGDSLVGQPGLLDWDALEMMTIRWADAVVSPSKYLLDWLGERDVLPDKRYVVRNFPTEHMMGMHKEYTADIEPIDHVIFFGRLERRKGLHLFTEAILPIMEDHKIKVTFLGKNSSIGGGPSFTWIGQEMDGAKRPWRIESEHDQPECMDIISEPGTLVCMPSLYENYPYTVMEAENLAVPFIAGNAGGVPEMVQADAFLCEPTAKDLERKIRMWVENTQLTMESALDQMVESATSSGEFGWSWKHVIDKISGSQPWEYIDTYGSPLVTVVIPTYNRPVTLERALASIGEQDYDNYEVIVVDDHSSEEFASVNKNLVEQYGDRFGYYYKQENKYLGEARNTGVSLANGDYVIFLDDDNVLLPDAIQEMVDALHITGADIAVSPLRIFQQVPENIVSDYFFTGELASGFFHNKMGDAMSIWKKEIFDVIKFTPDRAGHEDWELLVRAALRGCKIFPLVDPIFLYQQAPDGMLLDGDATKNLRRSMRPWYEDQHPHYVKQLILEIAMAQSRGILMLQHELEHIYQEHGKLVEYVESQKKPERTIMTPDDIRRGRSN